MASSQKKSGSATREKSAADKAADKVSRAKKSSGGRKAAPAKKTTAKKAAPAKKTTTKKAAPAKKTTTKKAAPAKKTTTKKAAPAKKAPTSPAKKQETPAKKSAKYGPDATNSQLAKPLAVLENESPWKAAELGEVRDYLESEHTRLRGEIERAESDLRALLREGVDGAGNDQADVGSNSLERDAEMSIAQSHRELLRQVDHALARIYETTYGSCESCGNPIGKMRLMAFPRATLCMTCKQREERR